jgi:hypothetical protein
MTTLAGVGISHHRDPRFAGAEAARDAMVATGGDTPPDFTFVFASIGYDQETVLRSVRVATGGAPAAGCSGEGIIVQGEADESPFSVAVMAFRSDEVRFDHVLVTGLGDDPEEAGADIVHQLSDRLGPEAKALMVFPDGITVNFDRLRAGLDSALDRPLPLFGGAAADYLSFEQTYQYLDDRVVSDAVVAVLVSGDVRPVWGISHSCFPLGARRTVTRCEGNVIHEIDGKPVLDVIREYLDQSGNTLKAGEWGQIVAFMPLGLVLPGCDGGEDEHLVRAITSQHEQGIALATEITEGTEIRIMRRDPERISAEAATMARGVQAELGGAPKAVFHFDCAGRGKIAIREQQKANTLARMQEALGTTVPWLGFYSFGEIAPVDDENLFHNWTAVLLALG